MIQGQVKKMRLDNFDLNLLVAFDILLQEKNVTKAAARAFVTQAAMSAQLKRLREAFQDEILAQQGKKMVPTPYALAMHPEITETIASLRALIARKGKFDPATSEREFKIVASDYITTVLLVPLLGAISTIAPFVKLDIALPYSNTNKSLADGELDMFLGPETFTHPDHPSELIFEERHVVVGWSGNPHMNEQMTIKRLSELGHVGVSISGGDTYIDAWMRETNIERRIEVRAPSFLQAPFLVLETNRVCLMHERLAQSLAGRLPLRIAELPFEVPPMREMLQFHATREKDPGLTWLREQIKSLATLR